MVQVRDLFEYLEKIGLMNMHEAEQTTRQKYLWRLYMFLQIQFLWSCCLLHLFSTVTRATRYIPEFCQALCEDAFLLTCLIGANFAALRTKGIRYFLNFTENCFSKADARIIQSCDRKSKILYYAILALLVGSAAGAVFETLVPLSPQEVELRRMIYRTQRPDRRLPYTARLLFLDETQPFVYEILYIISLYGVFLYVILMWQDFSILPIIIIHYEGQYKMLAKFTRKLGKRHFDEEGNEIFYTNVVKDEFVYVRYKDERGKRLDEDALLKRRHAYEQQYLKQIVEFHQKLVIVLTTALNLISPVMILVIFTCMLIIATLLIQLLLFDLTQISTARLVKMVVELWTVLGGYYFISNVSEIADDCNGLMRQALTDCAWLDCSNETRKDIIVLMLRFQRSNHLVLYDGAIILGRVFFLNTVKIAYSFVNFVRARV